MIDKKAILGNNYYSEYDIEIFNLTKKYRLKGRNKSMTALNNVNLKIKKGEIFGLLGPNGAGKTTLISILTTLLQPTTGYATILGRNILKDAWFIKENIGLMLGGEMIYTRLTGYRNLKFFSKLYGVKNYKEKISDLAVKLNLKRWLNQYTYTYSRGMKLKLALARVLLIEPKILFLDEPMLGLDPKSLVDVIKILKNLNSTIMITSHQMDVVEKLCDRIAFLNNGNILKVDTKENFKNLLKEELKIELQVKANRDDFIRSLKDLEFVSRIEINNDKILFNIKENSYFPELFNFLKDYPIIHFKELRRNLDDVFIKLSK